MVFMGDVVDAAAAKRDIILNNTFASGLLAYQETTKTPFFGLPRVLKSQTGNNPCASIPETASFLLSFLESGKMTTIFPCSHHQELARQLAR